MNVDNREYVFRVLNDVTKLPFLAEASSEFAINVIFHRTFPNGKRYLNDSSCLFNIGQTLPESFGFECCIPFRTKKAGKMSFASRPQR